MKAESGKATRRLAVRAALVAAYMGLLGLVLTLGKGHTILMDNKDAEDGSVKAFESMTVSVDGQEALEFLAGDRDQAVVRSQWHTIRIEAGGKTIVKKLSIPLMQNMVLLSIPKLAAGVEPALVPFVPLEEAPGPDESTSEAGGAAAPPAP